MKVLITAKNALEIGGPSEIFSTTFEVYSKIENLDIVDFSNETVWHPKTREIIVAEATNLNLDKKYDLVLASHVLEHIANPLKAIIEWKKVTVKGGHIVIVTPVKEHTFDHNRKVTEFEHLLQDYNNDVGEDDLSHLEEILEKHDLRMDGGAGTFTQFKERSLSNYKNRCLHHHVFDKNLIEQIANFADLDIKGTGFIKPYHLVTIFANVK